MWVWLFVFACTWHHWHQGPRRANVRHTAWFVDLYTCAPFSSVAPWATFKGQSKDRRSWCQGTYLLRKNTEAWKDVQDSNLSWGAKSLRWNNTTRHSEAVVVIPFSFVHNRPILVWRIHIRHARKKLRTHKRARDLQSHLHIDSRCLLNLGGLHAKWLPC